MKWFKRLFMPRKPVNDLRPTEESLPPDRPQDCDPRDSAQTPTLTTVSMINPRLVVVDHTDGGHVGLLMSAYRTEFLKATTTPGRPARLRTILGVYLQPPAESGVRTILEELLRQAEADGNQHSQQGSFGLGSPFTSVSVWPRTSMATLPTRCREVIGYPYYEALPIYLKKYQGMGRQHFCHIFFIYDDRSAGCAFALAPFSPAELPEIGIILPESLNSEIPSHLRDGGRR